MEKETIQKYIRTMKQALELNHTEAAKKALHEMEWGLMEDELENLHKEAQKKTT